ncbi:hypothetical protein M427DRAFT_57721 [Gonapodya prolifera JEL478]|uniref:MYND-type domain-containing protein n=1 Tax=Gonapodya prolifera (strain JEL478) TaxID=1344416 RepID=A0A139AC56_GONPJ|nr:hypothetical protein M427DRAFT_57721 [Gonapodya prolifera JEL478]|eukprot:KXS14249.1 hypothetical protein M427DRAFT_57721 [Gonapodya prolifera JEL478]
MTQRHNSIFYSYIDNIISLLFVLLTTADTENPVAICSTLTVRNGTCIVTPFGSALQFQSVSHSQCLPKFVAISHAVPGLSHTEKGAADPPALSLCVRCRRIRYSSPAFQKTDWKWHKRYCGVETIPSPEKTVLGPGWTSNVHWSLQGSSPAAVESSSAMFREMPLRIVDDPSARAEFEAGVA